VLVSPVSLTICIGDDPGNLPARCCAHSSQRISEIFGVSEERLASGEVVFLGVIEERAHFALDLSPVEAPLDMLRSPALAAPGVEAATVRFADPHQVGPRINRGEGRSWRSPARCDAFPAHRSGRHQAGHRRMMSYRIAPLAVFAVRPANYQPLRSRRPQKSWAADGSANDRTAGSLAVLSLFWFETAAWARTTLSLGTASTTSCERIVSTQRYHNRLLLSIS
jgi:hypothetical protein